MNKLIYCLRRRPDLTVEDFQTYWRTVHAPLVHERASVLGIVRYVQCHTRTDFTEIHAAYQARNGGSPEPFDGVAELWWEPRSARSEAAKQASEELLADERNFIDLPNSPMTMTAENVVVARERRFLIPTTDHDTTLAWHLDLFGWPIVRQWTEGSKGTLVAIDEGTRLEILEGESDFPAEPISGAAIVVEVADLSGVHRRAVGRGATITQEPELKPWGHRNMVLRDPNGLTVVAYELAG